MKKVNFKPATTFTALEFAAASAKLSKLFLAAHNAGGQLEFRMDYGMLGDDMSDTTTGLGGWGATFFLKEIHAQMGEDEIPDADDEYFIECGANQIAKSLGFEPITQPARIKHCREYSYTESEHMSLWASQFAVIWGKPRGIYMYENYGYRAFGDLRKKVTLLVVAEHFARMSAMALEVHKTGVQHPAFS